MDQKRVKRLPVVGEAGKILRIVSRSALPKPFFDRMEELRRGCRRMVNKWGYDVDDTACPAEYVTPCGARAPSGLTRFPSGPCLSSAASVS